MIFPISVEVVRFPELGLDVRSAFFKEHVKVGAYMCNVSESLMYPEGHVVSFQI